MEAPTVDQIVEQLRLLAKSLPQLVAARQHLRLVPQELPAMQPESMQGSNLEEYCVEARLQRLLRTQTI